jgi:hypothetical protein
MMMIGMAHCAHRRCCRRSSLMEDLRSRSVTVTVTYYCSRLNFKQFKHFKPLKPRILSLFDLPPADYGRRQKQQPALPVNYY